MSKVVERFNQEIAKLEQERDAYLNAVNPLEAFRVAVYHNVVSETIVAIREYLESFGMKIMQSRSDSASYNYYFKSGMCITVQPLSRTFSIANIPYWNERINEEPKPEDFALSAFEEKEQAFAQYVQTHDRLSFMTAWKMLPLSHRNPLVLVKNLYHFYTKKMYICKNWGKLVTLQRIDPKERYETALAAQSHRKMQLATVTNELEKEVFPALRQILEKNPEWKLEPVRIGERVGLEEVIVRNGYETALPY